MRGDLISSRLAIGLVVTASIMAMAVAASFLEDDPSFREVVNQPPGIYFIEKSLDSQEVRGEVLVDEWEINPMSADDSRERFEPPALVVASRHAVAGKPYITRVHLKDQPAPQNVGLVLGPPAGQYMPEEETLTWQVPDDMGGKSATFTFQYRTSSRQVVKYKLIVPVSKREHLLGTDDEGRDTLRRLFLSTRQVIFPGLIAVSLSIFLGTMVGALGGYYRGHFSRIIDFLVQMIGSFPRIILAMVITMVLKPDIYVVMAVLGIANTPRLAAMVRSRVSQLKDSQFVEAAKELGLRDSSIIGTHIIWHNCRPVILTQASFILGEAAALEAALAYVGAGSHWTAPSFGNMIVTAMRGTFLQQNYSQFLLPSIALAVAFMGFMLLGDGLCEWYRRKYGIVA